MSEPVSDPGQADLTGVPREDLEKRSKDLEYKAQMSALHGLSMSEEDTREYEAIQAELKTRGG